jgi:predicted SnoaL-like aldol condensation-catalyzing enzyme
MFDRIDRGATKYRPPKMVSLWIVFALFLLFDNTAVADHSYSDQFSIEVDPSAEEMVGEETFNDVMAFFHDAEKAIETRNLEDLMDLYSNNYVNGEHDKKAAEGIWTRIFSTFGSMAAHHNMRFVNVAPESNLVIVRCSGLLVGIPEGQKNIITIDNWNQQDHVLVKEAGRWKLIGTYGKQRKRLWFDKPMHPLF